MKKVISVLLLACMLLTLTACGAETPAAEPTAAPAEATEARRGSDRSSCR